MNTLPYDKVGANVPDGVSLASEIATVPPGGVTVVVTATGRLIEVSGPVICEADVVYVSVAGIVTTAFHTPPKLEKNASSFTISFFRRASPSLAV